MVGFDVLLILITGSSSGAVSSVCPPTYLFLISLISFVIPHNLKNKMICNTPNTRSMTESKTFNITIYFYIFNLHPPRIFRSGRAYHNDVPSLHFFVFGRYIYPVINGAVRHLDIDSGQFVSFESDVA